MRDEIILVDVYDNEIGYMEKLKAHRKPVLHRAFSIFLLDGDKILLQKRHIKKYHSGGLWANSCCSHPRRGEKLEREIHRRLYEELGMDCHLEEIGSFVYCSKYAENLYEYEYDHVFVGQYNGNIYPDEDEIEDVRWIRIEELQDLLCEKAQMFTSWFLTACPMVLRYMI